MMVDFKKKTLSSGLSLVMAPMATESVTVLGMVRAGSSDEKSNQYGGAHFLEHMVFKGTKKYPGVGDVSRAVEDVGGILNAFTGTEYTAFWVKAPAEAAPKPKAKAPAVLKNVRLSHPLLSESTISFIFFLVESIRNPSNIHSANCYLNIFFGTKNLGTVFGTDSTNKSEALSIALTGHSSVFSI